MSEQPFMQLWIADFIGDTLHLSAAEVGQYMLLLMASWRAGGFLSSDRAALSRVCREPVSDAVLAFFDEKDGQISQKRLLAELIRAKQLRNIRKEAGSKGGKAKALKNNEANVANAVAKQKQNRSIPEPEPLATKVAKRERRAHALPEDWLPSENHFSEGHELGFSRAEVESMAEDMRLWAGAKGETKKNWDMAFSGWMRREKKNGPRRGQGPPQKEAHFNAVVSQFLQEVSDEQPRTSQPRICGPSGEHRSGEFHATTSEHARHARVANGHADERPQIRPKPDD